MDNFKITKTILENINEQNDRINQYVDIVNGYTIDEEIRLIKELKINEQIRQQNELIRQEQYNNNENKFKLINNQLTIVNEKLDNITTEVINVKQPPNGLNKVKGNGEEDDTVNIKAIINYAKNKYKFYQNATNGYNVSRVKVYFPNGIYRISDTISIDGMGVIIEGNGAENTIFVLTDKSKALFKLGESALIYSKFLNFSCYCGSIIKRSDNLGYYIEKHNLDDTTNVSVCFDYTTSSGSTRYNKWDSIVIKGGFDKVFNIGGTTCHSENNFINCVFNHNNYVYYLNNSQSINHTFVGCSFEFINKSVFYVLAGGYINVYGGSFINPNDCLTLASTSTGVGIGSTNGHFYFNSAKWEMYQNYDNTKKPKLINCIGEQIAYVTFDNCSNTAGGGNDNDTIGNIIGSVSLNILNSSIKGIIDCEAKGLALTSTAINQYSTVNVTNCYYSPTFNKIGQYNYNINYTLCRGKFDYSIQSDYTGLSVSNVMKSLKTRMAIYNAEGNTHTLTFMGKVIPSKILIRADQKGGTAGSFKFYTDIEKTNLLGTIEFNTYVIHKLHSLTIDYSNFDYSKITNQIVIEWAPNGNNGYSRADIYIEYYCSTDW